LDSKFAGSNSADGDKFSRAIRIHNTPYFGGEVKPSDPSSVNPVLLLDDCWWDCKRALVDESEVSPVDIIPP
jgi:hypothetical protein